MSEVIEERVVSMEFDNEDFEKNVNQSIKSLEQLKQALNMDGISSSLTDISKSVSHLNEINMSKLTNTLDMVNNKFEMIKAIIGGTAIGKLTSRAMNAFGGLLKGAWNTVVTGGERRAQNLANAKFMLEGILNDGEAVNKVMDSVNESVTGTAYSLDAAAVVAAQFATTGIEGGQRMTDALKGVAGTAAMTNSSFEDIGMIFTKVAAKGHLMGDQINQLSYRGLNATEVLAKHLGKTGDEITKMVSKGQISFQTFSDAMTEAFGEHAFKANETYAGSLSNLNAAFARIGADVAAAKLESLKNVFNALRPLVNHLNTELTEFKSISIKGIETASNMAVKILENPLVKGVISDAAEVLTNVAYGLISVFVQIKEAFKEVFPNTDIRNIRVLTKFIVILSRNLILTGKSAEIVKRVFVGLFSSIKYGVVGVKILVSLIGLLISGIATLSTYITGLAINFVNTIKQLNTFSVVASTVESVIKRILFVLSSGAFAVTSTLARLTDLSIFKTLSTQLLKFSSNIEKIFSDTKANMSAFFNAVQKDAELANTTITKFGDSAKNAVVNIGNWFKDTTNYIVEFAKNIDWARIAVISFGLLTPIAIYAASKKLTEAFKPMLQIGDDIHKVLGSTKGALDEYKNSLAGNKYLKIAGSIAIIAASMAILVKVVDDADTGKFQVLALSMAALAASFALMTKFTNGKDANVISGAMLTFATGLLAISAALVLLGKVELDATYGVKFGMLLVVFGLMNAVTIAMGIVVKHLDANNKVFLSILPFIAALVAISYSLVKLNDVNLDGLADRVSALIAVMVALALVALAGEKMPVWSGINIILMSLSLKFVISTLSNLYEVLLQHSDKLKDLCKELSDVTDQFFAISALLLSAGGAIYLIGAGLGNIGKSMAGIGIGLFFIMAALRLVSTNKDEITESAIAILAMVGFVVAIEMLLALLADGNLQGTIKDSAKTMLALAGTVAILAGLTVLVSKIHPIDENIIVAFSGIVLLIDMIALVVWAAKDAKGAEKVLFGILANITVITAIMVALSYVEDWNKFAPGISLLTGLILGLALIFAGFEKITPKKGETALKALLAAVIALSIFIGEFIAVVKLTEKADLGTKIVSLILVIGLIWSLAGTMAILTKIRVKSNINKNLIALMGTLSICVSLIGFITAVMATNDYNSLATSVLPLATIFIGLAFVTEKLYKLGKKKLNKSVLAVLGVITACVATLVGMTRVLSKSKFQSIYATIWPLAAIFAGLEIVTEKIYKLGKKQLNDSVLIVLGVITACVDSIMVMVSILSAAGKNFVSIWSTIWPLTTIFVGLTLVTEALYRLNKKQLNPSVLATIGVIAGSVSLIVGMVSILAKNNFVSILATIVPLAAIVSSLGGLAVIFNQMKTQAGAYEGAAVALLIATSMSLILIALSKVAAIDIGSILASAGLMLTVAGILLAATFIFNNFLKVGAGAIEGAAVALVIAASISAVILSLSTLEKVNWTTVVYSLITATVSLGLLLGLITVIGEVAGKSPEAAGGIALVTVALVAIGFALIEFAAAATIFAYGANLMTSHIRLIISTVQNIPTFLDNLTDSICRDIPIIVLTITNAIDTILAKLEEAIPRIRNLGVDFQNGFIHTIGSATGLGLAYNAASSLVKQALKGIQDTQDSHSDAKKTSALGDDFNGGYNHTVGNNEAQSEAQKGGENLANAAIGGVESATDDSKISDSAENIVNTFASYLTSDSVLGFLTNIGQTLKSAVESGINGGGFSFGGMMQEAKKYVQKKTDPYSQKKSYQTALSNVPASVRKNIEGNAAIARRNNIAKAIGSKITEPFKPIIDDVTGAMKEATEQSTELANELTKTGGAAGGASKDIDKLTHSLKSMEELQSSLQDSISNSMDIFSEFSHESDLSADKLLSNMRSQVNGIKEWSSNLQKLAGRGIERSLLQKLTELGPQGWDKVQAFVNMTDDQLSEANNLYAESLMLPQSESEKITQSFAQAGMWASDGFVNGIYTNAGYQPGMLMGQSVLNGLKIALDAHSPSEETKKIGGYATEGLVKSLESGIDSIRSLGSKMGIALIQGIKGSLGKAMMTSIGRSVVISFANAFVKATVVTTAVKTFCNNIKITMEKRLLDVGYIELAHSMMNNIILGYQEGTTEFLAEIDVQNKILSDKMLETFTEVGTFVGEGLEKGIHDKIQDVADETIKLCDEVVKSARETFDENSPSKVFDLIGNFIPLGLANGISRGSSKAINATNTMADSTIKNFEMALDKVRDYIQNGTDDDLTITPVMDLSNIDSGLKHINTAFGSRKLNLSSTLDNASRIAAAFGNSGNNAGGSMRTNTIQNNYTFNQTNTSPKALSNAEIYRQTNNLINRYRNDIVTV